MNKPKRISESEYQDAFSERKRGALKRAWKIRKFEIDLYWRRATYFWTFIGASFAGYGAVQASSTLTPAEKGDLSVWLSCVGLVVSFAWFLGNKGSKQWQENWENHIDMLEDEVVGPLYKTVLRRTDPSGRWGYVKEWITGPGPWQFSVSKVNQLVSLYVCLLWLFLLGRSVWPLSWSLPINWEYVVVIGASFVACVAFLTLGRTAGSYSHAAHQRESRIEPLLDNPLSKD